MLALALALGTAAHVHAAGTVTAVRSHVQVAIVLTIDPGFHVYAYPPSLPELIPTTVTFPAYPRAHVSYPPPELFKTTFEPVPLRVYTSRVVFTAELPATATPIASIRAIVRTQACTAHLCLRPSDIPVRLSATRAVSVAQAWKQGAWTSPYGR